MNKTIINQHPQIYQNVKIRAKLEPKIPDLGIFRLEFEKDVLVFEISTLDFVENEFLDTTVYFSIGSNFWEMSRISFFGGSGPGQSPLYKVCRIKMNDKTVHIHVFFKKTIFLPESQFS